MEILFQLGNENILVVINGKDVKFGSTEFGAQLADINGLKLDYNGVCREFPDLETRDDWKEEACARFKEKIRNMENEEERAEYLIEELSKLGYTPLKKQRRGHRPVKL